MRQNNRFIPIVQQRERSATVLRFQPVDPVKPKLELPAIKRPKGFKTFADDVARRVTFLRKADHLKYCPLCGAVQYRRYETIGPMTIDPDRNTYRIIYPRVSGSVRCFKWPIFNWFFGVPSYKTHNGWYLVRPKVCCPTKTCPNNEFHVYTDREGIRKISLQRRFTEWLKSLIPSWLPGGIYTFREPDRTSI
jgi:hypothetical protein